MVKDFLKLSRGDSIDEVAVASRHRVPGKKSERVG